MNKKLVLLFSWFLLIFLLPFASGDAELSLEYEVIQANEKHNTWYNLDYSEYVNYTVQAGSKITIDVTESGVFNSGVNIEIGNITKTNIGNEEIENALALGYWQLPNQFGIFANTSWDASIEDFNELELINSSFEETGYEVLAGEIFVYKISFFDGFQNTTLVYEEESGYLIYAFTTVFDFFFEMQISSINGNAKYYEGRSTGSFLFVNPFVIVFALSFFSYLRKKLNINFKLI